MNKLFRPPVVNSLLGRLLRTGLNPLSFDQDRVLLQSGQVLHEAGEEVSTIYFPETCLVCLSGKLNLNSSHELGLIGKDGLVGITAMSGKNPDYTKAVVQKPGSAVRISAAVLQLEMQKNPQVQMALFEYINQFLAQTIQIAACSKFHLLEARLARYLLTTKDHLGSTEFHLTHEFIAQSLGVRRVGVTKAAVTLQRLQLISYSRGEIKILDESGLMNMTCDCYRLIREIGQRGGNN
ncbi:Crp/Fnr family transcriptional regulator [Undibacterium sp. RuTC16W]|uniref:Crp/Fnr family transcriptional regulator n=1 Tax=Undibacterium sp. RuTC16W TaxID=3413048 RepID=UPI003BF3A2C1